MGMSLDDLMRYLYENFGLQNKRYQTSDILAVLNEISSHDWTAFFDKYVYGTDELPLSGDFKYLDH